MFTWSENYFTESTVSFGMLTICSDWSLCTMLLQQYARRLLICLPSGAGGEILHWAVGSWRAGTGSYLSCVPCTVSCSSKVVNKYWMRESLYTRPHCLIPWHKISPPPSALSCCPGFFLFWVIIASCRGICGWFYYVFIISFPQPDSTFPEGRDWTGLISYISLP